MVFTQTCMKNEYGEEIAFDAVERIAQRIQKLAEEEVDELWCNCGWIDAAREEARKALPISRIASFVRVANGPRSMCRISSWKPPHCWYGVRYRGSRRKERPLNPDGLSGLR